MSHLYHSALFQWRYVAFLLYYVHVYYMERQMNSECVTQSNRFIILVAFLCVIICWKL